MKSLIRCGQIDFLWILFKRVILNQSYKIQTQKTTKTIYIVDEPEERYSAQVKISELECFLRPIF